MKKLLKSFLGSILLLNFLVNTSNAKENNENNINNNNKITTNSANLEKLKGKWVLNTYIGKKVFKDNLEILENNNSISGTLSVTNVFSSKIENFKLKDNSFTFEIEVKEGKPPYSKVKYECFFNSQKDIFVGFLSMLENDELVGAFVSERIK
ncbi:MAG: hypothetical protein U0457_09645 [Candidatus Sericytochromatia bacterium]